MLRKHCETASTQVADRLTDGQPSRALPIQPHTILCPYFPLSAGRWGGLGELALNAKVGGEGVRVRECMAPFVPLACLRFRTQLRIYTNTNARDYIRIYTHGASEHSAALLDCRCGGEGSHAGETTRELDGHGRGRIEEERNQKTRLQNCGEKAPNMRQR